MFRMLIKVNYIRLSVACVALGSYSAAGLCPARAQSPQTLKAFASEGHVGPVEKALVGVEVNFTAQDSSPATRHGNGVVIRCDGFVLTSQALFGASVNSSQKVWVTLNPGAEGAKRIAARIVGGVNLVRRVYAGKPEPFVVLKLADVHQPALRLLLPDALTAESTAQIAWSAWNAQAGRFLPIRKRNIALLDPAKQGLVTNSRWKFAQNETVPVSGAVIIGPDEMGFGLVTSAGGSSPDFATFTTLNSLTNCVTPQSATDAQFQMLSQLTDGGETGLSPAVPLSGSGAAGQTGTTQATGTDGAQTSNAGTPDTENLKPAGTAGAGGMVRVGGGPVRLNPMLQLYQPDMAPAQTACVAPFWIDRFEVTNAQYWKFWQSLPLEERQRHKAEYYPVAWAEGTPFPQDMGVVPVLGIRLAGAQAYAKWAGKRLPTPYEWSLAAFGQGGGTAMPAWVQKYVQDRQQTFQRIVEAHVQYAAQNPAVNTMGEENWNGVHFGAQPQLPWLFWYPWEALSARWSSETVLRLTEHLWRDWKNPQHVLAAGSRPFDVSPYGARDMIFNADELVMPGRDWSALDTGAGSEFYMQVGFPDMPPAERQGWMAFYHGRAEDIPPSLTYRGVRIPLSSRRLRGPITLGVTDSGIYHDYLLLNANLREVSDMMAYTSGGVVSLELGPAMPFPDFFHRNAPAREEEPLDLVRRYGEAVAGKLKPLIGRELVRTNFQDTGWFPFWKNADVPFHREMGRDVTIMPLAAPPTTQQQDPNMSTYLVPGGFRCAR